MPHREPGISHTLSEFFYDSMILGSNIIPSNSPDNIYFCKEFIDKIGSQYLLSKQQHQMEKQT
jgi:hypothetical protein